MARAPARASAPCARGAGGPHRRLSARRAGCVATLPDPRGRPRAPLGGHLPAWRGRCRELRRAPLLGQGSRSVDPRDPDRRSRQAPGSVPLALPLRLSRLGDARCRPGARAPSLRVPRRPRRRRARAADRRADPRRLRARHRGRGALLGWVRSRTGRRVCIRSLPACLASQPLPRRARRGRGGAASSTRRGSSRSCSRATSC